MRWEKSGRKLRPPTPPPLPKGEKNKVGVLGVMRYYGWCVGVLMSGESWGVLERGEVFDPFSLLLQKGNARRAKKNKNVMGKKTCKV